jgi:hypothetical protein
LRALQVTPSSNIVASGPQRGSFVPSAFKYTLTAPNGFVRYSISNVPNWLSASSWSGTATKTPKTITFSVNSSANELTRSSYVGSINFNNTTNHQANTTRLATLTVDPTQQYTIAVSASPSADGTVSGGGTFAAGSSQTVTATANAGYSFINWTANGSVVSTSTSYTLTLNNNTTLAANFATTAGSIIPSDRNFAWNPGMISKGGIPNRTAICATLSPSGGDDSAAIQAKLDRCPSNQVVMLNPGTFTVNNHLLIHTPITLRGAGAGQTILNKTNGARPRTSTVVPGTTGILTPIDPGTYTHDVQPIVIVGPRRWPKTGSSQNLTADGQQGSLSVSIANASGYAAGQFVLLDETSGASWQPVPPGFGCTHSAQPSPCPPQVWQGDRVAWNMHYPTQTYQDDNANSNASGPYNTAPGTLPAAMSWFSRTDRPTNEIKEIASVSGNMITFTSPLTISYRTSHNAQLTQYPRTDAQIMNAGIENLTVIGGSDGAIRFENAAYAWAKAVEVTQWLGEGVAVDGSFRVEVRDSYIHAGSWPEPGGAGYALSLAVGSSEALVENNIFIDANKVMVFRSSGAGSVVGYNYTDDGWIFGTETWAEAGITASHMAGPHHVLFEGNYSFNADSDYTHGNAIYVTFFRNWLSGQRKSFTDANHRAVGMAYGSWWDSFVGNVLGRRGQMAGWRYADPAMSCDGNGNNCTGNNAKWTEKVLWQLGYDAERWGMHPDPQTLSTVIRDGNYDFLTNSQRWHNTPGGFTIPSSMYLTAKPAFFGSNPWPWVDPTTGTIYTLPAKARHDAGTPLCGC